MLQTSTSTSTTKKESKSTSIQANLEEDLKSQMTEHLMNFNEPFLFSDAVLVAEDKELHCHRIILSLNSPVFQLLFQSSFKEANSKVVKVPEEYEDMLSLLRYLYEFNAKDFPFEKAVKLLPIVHKYQMKELIDQMERTIIYNTPEYESASLINIGSKYDLEKMRQTGIETIAKFPLERCQKIFNEEDIPYELRSKIMERRVQLLEKSITDIQKSFSNSCLKIESKVAKVPSNHCSEHGGPLTCISFVSQNITNSNNEANQPNIPQQQNPNEHNPDLIVQSNVSASIRPYAPNANQLEMQPPQQNPHQPIETTTMSQKQENGVCTGCVENLKSHITDICMRSMHKVPIVLFKNS